MTTRTLTETLAVAASGLGTWWPNPWWPNGRSTYNDCAAFVSWALYGIKDGQPVYTYVPHIMDRAIAEGRWHGGRALTARPTDRRYAEGIQAGDVVIFDWRFRGSRDHVGIALAAPKDGGIRVRQANNGGGGTGRGDVRDPAEDITYGTQFVLGYYRPPYKAPAPAGGTTTPITSAIDQEDDEMIHVHNIATKGTYAGWQGTLAPKFSRHIAKGGPVDFSRARLRIVAVNGDNELGDIHNLFGISRTRIPTNGKEVYLGGGATGSDVTAAASSVIKTVTASIAKSLPTVDQKALAAAVEVALQGGIVEQVEAGVTNVLRKGTDG